MLKALTQLTRAKGLPFRLAWSPYAALVAGLGLSALAALGTANGLKREEKARFEAVSLQIENRILTRLEQYEGALRHTRAFFEEAGIPDRAGFHRYFAGLDLLRWLPGIRGLGYASLVEASDYRRFQDTWRRKQGSGFALWPPGDRADRTSIVLLEPTDERNRGALGYDMMSEPVRREAMIRARESGMASVSGKVILVQDAHRAEIPGFLMYLPLYLEPTGAGASSSDSAPRARPLAGFVYAAFRASNFFAAALKDLDDTDYRPRIRIFDGTSLDRDSLLYEHEAESLRALLTHDPEFHRRTRVYAGGRAWTIVNDSLPGHYAKSIQYAPGAIFAGGSIISFLLFWLVWIVRRHAARAEQAVLARDNFLSLASHELKTPLTSLKLQLQLRKRLAQLGRASALTPEAQLAQAAIDEKQLDRLNRLIENMLDISKIRTGHLALHLETFDLHGLVRESLEQFAPQLADAGIQALLEDGPPVIGTWDRYRIEQVVFNLMMNAVKYGRGEPIVIKTWLSDRLAHLSIQDRGIGIASEHHAKIFDRFERAVSPNEVSGLGLGLYIVSQILRVHGGTVRVESQPDLGATFTVSLPLSPPSADSKLE